MLSMASARRRARAGDDERFGAAGELAVKNEEGQAPEVVAVEVETNTAAISPGSSPRRLRALSEAAPQSRSTGPDPSGPRRWIQAWERPPLPKASPLPAKVTVRAGSSGTATLWLSRLTSGQGSVYEREESLGGSDSLGAPGGR